MWPSVIILVAYNTPLWVPLLMPNNDPFPLISFTVLIRYDSGLHSVIHIDQTHRAQEQLFQFLVIGSSSLQVTYWWIGFGAGGGGGGYVCITDCTERQAYSPVVRIGSFYSLAVGRSWGAGGITYHTNQFPANAFHIFNDDIIVSSPPRRIVSWCVRLTVGWPVSGEWVVCGAARGSREAAHPARGFESPRRGEAGRMTAGKVHRFCLHLHLHPENSFYTVHHRKVRHRGKPRDQQQHIS